jgi:hypothetical protein
MNPPQAPLSPAPADQSVAHGAATGSDQSALWTDEQLDETDAAEGATASERTAVRLAAAEQRLADAIKAYLAAKRAWADEMRRIGHGASTEELVAAAQSQLTESEAARDAAERRIDRLRVRLHEERRRELLMETVADQTVAHAEALRRLDKPPVRRSLLGRIFGRR